MIADPAKQPAPVVASLRSARPSGWWGMACLIATEGSLFGTLVASYFYLRFRVSAWPPPGTPRPALTVAIVLAFVLVATSVPMQAAVLAARRGRLGTVRLALGGALLVQAGYFAMQMQRFTESLDRFGPERNAYSSIYYTLLGGHHAHVLVGLLLNAFLLFRLRTGLTNYRLNAIESTALYWHFVNVLALVVTGTILSARA